MSPILSFLSINTVLLLFVLLFVLFKYTRRNHNYWKNNNVPYVKPYPIFGNFFSVMIFQKSISDILTEYYNKFTTSPFFGIFIFDKPYLVVKDPEIIRLILVKDFSYFYDRCSLSDEKCDAVSANMLFFLKNPEWKQIRTKMTPVFTSGKIKNMVQLINDAGQSLKKYIDANLRKDSIESKEMCAKFSTDVITSCAFGINAESFKYENAQFRSVGRQMFDFKWKNAFRQTMYFLAPNIAKLLRLPFFDNKVTSFLRDVFWQTIDQRGQSKMKRNDLIDIIRDFQDETDIKNNFKFDGDKVVAQAAQFFAAGFETVSATMAFTLYELSLNTEIQKKLITEVSNTLLTYKELTYEAVQSMKYLHMVVCETLRKYPVLPFLDRMCIADYKIPKTNFVLKKGTPVFIPMLGLHNDPNFFPNPEVFDPERFSDGNKEKLSNFTYIPFGDGPRNCIGERFGLLVTKLGLSHIFSEYEVEKCADTPIPIKFTTKSFLLASTVGLSLKFKNLQSK